MKRLIAGLLALLLAGCSGMANANGPEQESQEQTENPSLQPDQTQAQPPLENLGSAPELDNEVWLNTDVPLRLADLRGQVVLLDMWTFG
jgi:PBP1b-binding outer membrane lipoprotein LpoB